MSAENTNVIQLLQQQNQKFIEGKASKNIIIRILVENHALIIQIQEWPYLKNLQRLIANFDKRDLGQGNIEKLTWILVTVVKLYANWLYLIHQRRDNLKTVKKKKDKIMKNVNSSNDIQVGNRKKIPQTQNFNNI